jgi:hypothetical protein
MEELSKCDAVIVWGGTRDASKNETRKGLSSICNFVKIYSNTNILVMNLPSRYDLKSFSCVNQEVNIFNRKLGKVMKIFDMFISAIWFLIMISILGMAYI